MSFTLDEIVVKYTWPMQVDTPEDILDLAPRPRPCATDALLAKQRNDMSLQCMSHKSPWRELLNDLEAVCRDEAVSPLLELVKTHVEENMCTCKGQRHISGVFNMPSEIFEQEVWDLYTYFLNTFNSRLKSDSKLLDDLKKAIHSLCEQCILFMDVQRYFFLRSVKSLLEVCLLDNLNIMNGDQEPHTTS